VSIICRKSCAKKCGDAATTTTTTAVGNDKQVLNWPTYFLLFYEGEDAKTKTDDCFTTSLNRMKKFSLDKPIINNLGSSKTCIKTTYF